MKEYDVIVGGGGIHGAGVLQAIAAAGYSGLLIEKHAVASGTSSRSSRQPPKRLSADRGRPFLVPIVIQSRAF